MLPPQTSGGHLSKLAAADLVRVEKQGGHRYHRLATPAIAQMLESIMQVASSLEKVRPALATASRDTALRAAGTCYGYLAGHLGVALTEALVTRGHVELTHDARLITDTGIASFERIGIDVVAPNVGRGRTARVLCRPCLDWSERRPHLAGAVGAALYARSFQEHWIRPVKNSRAVTVTPRGWRNFRDAIGVRQGER